MTKNNNNKSLESWIWGAACSIRGVKDAPKYKDYILPLIFVKRLCDVFDDEINRISQDMNLSREKAFELVQNDKSLVRFYLPLKPENPSDYDKEKDKNTVWSVIRNLSSNIGERLTTHLRDIARENSRLKGIIDRIDFNATTHGQRDINDDNLSNLIEKISQKRLGLDDVEPDIIGRSYEYLIRKFAEGSGKSAGEFYTPKEVGILMAKIMNPQSGMGVYDPCCGSGGLLIKLQLELLKNNRGQKVPLKLFGQEFIPGTWAMAQMNMIIHDMEGEIELGDTMRHPKFIDDGLKKFDRVVANPMWNQGKDSLSYWSEEFVTNDQYNRFPGGYPGGKADWGWLQHILASLKDDGRAAVVLDTGAASRGSGNVNKDKEKEVRKWFVEKDHIEGVIYLPENLFYNTTAPGIIIFLNKNKEHKNKIFLLNASKEFEKGDPKNFLPDESIEKIAETYQSFEEKEKFSKLVDKNEIVKNDYNISPSRYIFTGEEAEYRPVNEIWQELQEVEKEVKETDTKVEEIMDKLEM